MQALVRGFLRNAHVLFNGDINANKELNERTQTLAKLNADLSKAKLALTKPNPTADQVKSVNRLLNAIAKESAEKNNALVISLIHPGEDGTQKVIKPLVLGNGANHGVNVTLPNDFLENGLFKRTVLGEFGIQVEITDTDQTNPFLMFLRQVLAAAFSTVSGGRIGNISNVLTSSAASQLSGDITGAIKGKSDDKVTVVATSEIAKFQVKPNGSLALKNPGPDIAFVGGELTLELRAPRLMKKSRNTYMNVGAGNGSVKISLTT